MLKLNNSFKKKFSYQLLHNKLEYKGDIHKFNPNCLSILPIATYKYINI